MNGRTNALLLSQSLVALTLIGGGVLVLVLEEDVIPKSVWAFGLGIIPGIFLLLATWWTRHPWFAPMYSQSGLG